MIQSKFEIPGKILISKGFNGLEKMVITTAYSSAEIYSFGAHITSFKPFGKPEMIWLSPNELYVPGKAIRGGVPICFPWFGGNKKNKDFPAHGFARIMEWDCVETGVLSDNRVKVVMELKASESTLKFWTYDFSLRLTAIFGKELEIELQNTNMGSEPFLYEECFHTYFRVDSVQHSIIHGLDGAIFMDRMKEDQLFVQSGAVKPNGPLTHLYLQCADTIEINDSVNNGIIETTQYGFANTVVLTPGDSAIQNFPDISTDWDTFV